MSDFISEDDLKTFEEWLRYQAVDPKTPEELVEWRQAFEEAKERAASITKVGLMKLQPVLEARPKSRKSLKIVALPDTNYRPNSPRKGVFGRISRGTSICGGGQRREQSLADAVGSPFEER